MMNITYEEISKENVAMFKDIQRRIFPENSFEKGFDMLLEKGPESLGNIMQTYFIIRVDDESVGLCGYYIPNGVEEHHSIWIGWYGLLPEFRGKGLGSVTFRGILDNAKRFLNGYDVKYLRLYTDEKANASAQPMYNKYMTLKEYYRNDEMFSESMLARGRKMLPGKTDSEYKEIVKKLIAIFSISLTGEILVPWDNYYMNYEGTLQTETDSTGKRN